MKSKRIAWLLLYLLTGLTLCTIYGCATANRLIPIWMYPFPDDQNALAMTSCDFVGNPIILINQTAYEGEDYAEWYWEYIFVHENQHVRDLLAHPMGCVGGLSRYNVDRDFRMEMELRAECAEWMAMLRDKRAVQGEFFFRFYNQWHLYGQHLDIADFFKSLDCAREDVWQPQEVANVSS